MRAGVGPQNGVSADVVGVAHSPTDMVGLDQKIVEIVLGVHNRTEVVEKLKILIETGEMSCDDVLDRADWMVSPVVEVTANFRGDGLRHIVLRTVRQQGGTWPKASSATSFSSDCTYRSSVEMRQSGRIFALLRSKAKRLVHKAPSRMFFAYQQGGGRRQRS